MDLSSITKERNHHFNLSRQRVIAISWRSTPSFHQYQPLFQHHCKRSIALVNLPLPSHSKSLSISQHHQYYRRQQHVLLLPPFPSSLHFLHSRLLLEGDFTVVNTVASPQVPAAAALHLKGKWSVAYGSVAVVSLTALREATKHMLRTWSKQSLTPQSFDSSFRAVDDLATQYLIQSAQHASFYTHTNMGKSLSSSFLTLRRFTTYASEIAHLLPSTATTQYLLYSALQSLGSITVLLDQVFAMIVIIITLVAVYVIYILLRSSLQDKLSFSSSSLTHRAELTLLRLVGLRKSNAVSILLTQLLFFTLPGIVAGLLLSLVLYFPLALLLNNSLHLDLPRFPPISSYFLSSFIGLLSPLLALVAPTLSFLKQARINAINRHHFVGSPVFQLTFRKGIPHTSK